MYVVYTLVLLSLVALCSFLCCLALLHFAASCSYCALSAGSAAGRGCLALLFSKSIAAHLSYEWAAVVAIGQTTYRPSSRCQLATFVLCCAARKKVQAVPWVWPCDRYAAHKPLCVPWCSARYFCESTSMVALWTQCVHQPVFSVAALLLLGDLCSTCTGAYCVQACVCHSTLQKDACRMLWLLNVISALSFVCACVARMRYCDQSECCGLSRWHACPFAVGSQRAGRAAA